MGIVSGVIVCILLIVVSINYRIKKEKKKRDIIAAVQLQPIIPQTVEGAVNNSSSNNSSNNIQVSQIEAVPAYSAPGILKKEGENALDVDQSGEAGDSVE